MNAMQTTIKTTRAHGQRVPGELVMQSGGVGRHSSSDVNLTMTRIAGRPTSTVVPPQKRKPLRLIRGGTCRPSVHATMRNSAAPIGE